MQHVQAPRKEKWGDFKFESLRSTLETLALLSQITKGRCTRWTRRCIGRRIGLD
jgi:hypothetical protein